MNKNEIIELFVKKHILSNKTSLIRRPWNWKSYFDDEAQNIFNEFSANYRSNEEAWFCLCRGIELPICPICHKKKVKFTGITKYGAVGYNTTCEDCSANAVIDKIEKFRITYSNKTPEQRKEIFNKRKITNKERYGDEDYSLFGSSSFKQNLKDKYGNEHYNNIDKRRETCVERYNVTSNLLIPEIHERAVANSWTVECREKRIQHNIENYGLSCEVCSAVYIDKAIESKRRNIKKIEIEHDCLLLSDVVKKYGQGFKSMHLEYLRFGSNVFVKNCDISLIEKYINEGMHTNGYVSKLEKDVLEYVKSICNYEVIENCTSAVLNENHRFFELDIFIPEIKLAIDFNGTYWHST